tara:strand:- start:84 stop:725 length:642 start_codon:yes stop_codon:yes gene_type:complete
MYLKNNMKKYTITKSKQNNYVWFQIAKNASRTLINCLNDNTELDLGFPLHLNKDDGYHEPYKSEYDDYFKFTIVRNPWDRFLSFYLNKVGRKSSPWNQKGSKSFYGCTFEESVIELKTTDLEDKDCDIHYRSQTEMFPLDNIDYIGRFENLQEDFNFICDKIKIPHQQLPHKNKTKDWLKHKHYTEYYDEETKQIVAEKYAKDIETFGYKFGE